MRTTVTSLSEPPEGVSQQIVAADESLRKSFSGLPVEDILPEVERSLAEIGVEVPDTQVRDYAQHISDRADYEFVLP
ncbi:hypothetical protein [Aeromicrobium sp. 9AM]|uniref:hypothetical protein n=1 Tax=Aeromicrobium sp. 9AM TaxID=2653126 RepID=UPI0012F2C452|nr:hypothetical protein [Aeromicrobium sp. 9AM]VXB38977.1 conserved hypothetical protein [Aeromicrobium sp. 9AM]